MAVLIDAEGNTKQLGNIYPAEYLLQLIKFSESPVVYVNTDEDGKIQTWRFKKFCNGKRMLVTFASED